MLAEVLVALVRNDKKRFRAIRFKILPLYSLRIKKVTYVKRQSNEIPLLAGDVLLVQGTESSISSLKNNSDVVLIDWTRKYLPQKKKLFVLLQY